MFQALVHIRTLPGNCDQNIEPLLCVIENGGYIQISGVFESKSKFEKEIQNYFELKNAIIVEILDLKVIQSNDDSLIHGELKFGRLHTYTDDDS